MTVRFPSDLVSFRFCRSIIAEFVGTTMFIFASIGAAITNPGQAAAIFGASTAMVIYSIGPTSGGHLNPAVTFTLCFFGHYNFFKGAILIMTQFLASATGVALVHLLSPFNVRASLNKPTPCVTTLQAFILEVFGTAMLTFVLYTVAVDPKANEPAGRAPLIAPAVIGLAVFIAHVCLIPLTNCGINPARSFGSALIANEWADLPLFILAPMIGGPLGAALHYLPALLTDNVETAVVKIREAGANTAMKVTTTETNPSA